MRGPVNVITTVEGQFKGRINTSSLLYAKSFKQSFTILLEMLMFVVPF